MDQDKLPFSTDDNRFEFFFKAYCVYASTLGTTLNTAEWKQGLLNFGITLTTAQYAAKQVLQDNEPNGFYLREGIFRKAPGGTAFVQAVTKDHNIQADIYAQACADARRWWEDRMDPLLLDWLDTQQSPSALDAPAPGRWALDIHELLTILQDRFYILTPNMLLNVKKIVMIPISSITDFPVIMSKWNTTWAILDRNSQPESESAKLEFLTNAVSGSPILYHTLCNYTDLHPKLSDRSWAAAVSYMSALLAGRQSTAPLGQALHSMDTIIAEQVRLQVAAALAAIPATATAPSPAPARNRLRSTSKTAPATTVPSPQTPKRERPIGTPGYCWFHGSGGHKGSECISMTDAKGFTSAHRKATSGIVISGVAGHT